MCSSIPLRVGGVSGVLGAIAPLCISVASAQPAFPPGAFPGGARTSPAFVQCEIGWVSQRREGFAACEQLRDRARTEGDRDLEITALVGMGRILKAEREIERAIAILEE
ncbi:MAG: hypothetical protein AAFX40_13830, partial [Cyanobacteria bacterium J06639_1]